MNACVHSSKITCIPAHVNPCVAQERSHTAEAKLQETTTQLEELQVKQRQLEARNLLLEKVARLNKQTVLREAHEPVPLPWEVHSTAQLLSLAVLPDQSHCTAHTSETSNTVSFVVFSGLGRVLSP